jgi:hypothetical protein
VLAALRVVPANERLEIVLERQDRYGLLAAYEIERLSKSTEVPEVMLMEDGETPKLSNWRFIETLKQLIAEASKQEAATSDSPARIDSPEEQIPREGP